MTKLSTYLLFDGTCKKAMEFYHARLGGKLAVTQVSDSPLRNQMPPHLQNKVLNARLEGDGFDFSASDWMHPSETPLKGNTVCLYFSGGTRSELKALFEKLSEGANVTDPLKEMPFLYGALTDKFGVRWMFHAD